MLLFLGEALLALVGVQPMTALRDPYVGFAKRLPLFIEETGSDEGIMRTAPGKLMSFNPQRFSRVKEPGAYRIFCLGGSTTYGRPWRDTMSFCGWLRRFLLAMDPASKWEVINAGGVSYASYRVAAVMEEVSAYQPDLIVVYSGHNEFIEERSYREIRDIPDFIVEANAVLGQSRIFTALANTINRAQDPVMMDAEVSDRLSNTVGPENYHRDDANSADIRAHYRLNLKRMVSLARAVNSELIFVMPAANHKDMAPFKSELSLPSEVAVEWLQRFGVSLEIEAPQERLAALDSLLALDDRYAAAHYERGHTLLGMGRYDEAQAAFVRAIDEDIAPLRMLSSMQDDLRSVASQYDVPLIDYPKLIEAHNRKQLGHAILGKEWFPDHVHLTIEGYRLLGLELLQYLESRGVLKRPIDDSVIAAVSAEALDSIDTEANALALTNLGVVLAWAGRLEEGHRLLLQARELIGDTLPLLLRLGRSAERMRKPTDAAEFYARAVLAHPSAAEPHRRLAQLARNEGRAAAEIQHLSEAARLSLESAYDQANYAEALATHDRWPEAARQYSALAKLLPTDATVRFNLGIALVNSGQPEAAEEELARALSLDPALVSANMAIAGLAEAAGEATRAQSHYERAVAAAPDDADTRLNFGAFLATRGAMREAVDHFRAAVRLAPESADAHYNLALALRQSGNIDEAESHFATANRLSRAR